MAAIVRDALIDDAAAIAAIQVATWQEAYRGIVPESYLAAMSVEARTERWRDAIETRLRGQSTLVASSGGKVVGSQPSGRPIEMMRRPAWASFTRSTSHQIAGSRVSAVRSTTPRSTA